MDSDPNASPINALPIPVVLLALPMVLVELALQAGAQGFVGGPGAVGWRLSLIQDYAFFAPVFQAMLDTGSFPPEHLVRFVTYPFVHMSITHLIMVLVFLLALGKLAGEVFGTLAVYTIFFGSAVGGALVYWLLTNDPTPIVGGYPAVYGLIGAYSFILWARLAATGESRYRAFGLIAALMFIQLVFGLLFGAGKDWIADLAGFCSGFLLSFLVSPGGWHRVVTRLRQR